MRVPPKANDYQIGGSHYKNVKYQPWDVMEDCSRTEFLGFLRNCALKYLLRKKGGTKKREEDLRKAHHCLTKYIEVLDSRPGSRP